MQVRFISIRPLFLFTKAMDSDASCSLVLCGKSSVETDTAARLKNNNVLKLPHHTKVSLFLEHEAQILFKDDSFSLSLFLNSISTHRFGRFLIWSPRLSSTHDVVSHNFSELPLGSVCVTDIQFKGRGRSKNVWELKEDREEKKKLCFIDSKLDKLQRAHLLDI